MCPAETRQFSDGDQRIQTSSFDHAVPVPS